MEPCPHYEAFFEYYRKRNNGPAPNLSQCPYCLANWPEPENA